LAEPPPVQLWQLLHQSKQQELVFMTKNSVYVVHFLFCDTDTRLRQ
jgi:hypothetical protein